MAVVFGLLGALMPGLLAVPASAVSDPDHINFELSGCRNNGGIVLPDGSGNFICADANYTTGNLGKGWNELDLVPHRVTLTNNGANQTYIFIVAGDYRHAVGDTFAGWDFISPLVLNAGKSDASCQAAVSGSLTITPVGGGAGGASQTIYRTVTVTQQSNTTCIYDYYQRLALGAHNFSGSSLQSNLWNQALSANGIGQKRIQLPVNEILPQELRKTMSATRNADFAWNVVKAPTPANLTFTNTCSTAVGARSASVAISLSWTKLPGTVTGYVVITNIYASNPAARVITVNVSDQIRSGTTVLDTASAGPINIPANTEQLVLTHTQTILPSQLPNPASPSFNDIATATYTDLVTGIPVPGNTTATASVANSAIGNGTITNASAVITDTESIVGAGLTFSVATPSIGSFTNGYVAGTQTVGPVNWSSGVQSGSGSVTFNKTVFVAPAGITTSGSLNDTATLTGSNGFTTSGSASVGIDASAVGVLTINKSIPNVLTGSETVTFTFRVKDSLNNVVASPTITFNAGDTLKAIQVGPLALGNYTVSEDPLAPWAPVSDAPVTLGCTGSVSITNGFGPAVAQVRKITVPAGNEAGWTFTLNGPGTPVGGESVVTAGVGPVQFVTVLQDGGSYTITETPRAGFDQSGSSGDCSFTVNYPDDADRVFSCAFTNTQRGAIIVRKVTNPAGGTGFTFSGDVAGTIDDGGSLTVSDVVPGTYTSTEAAKAGWDLTNIVCSDQNSSGDVGNRLATFHVEPGETVVCTFTNVQRGTIRVVKRTNPAGGTGFTYTGDAAGTIDDGGTITVGNLVPGVYTSVESAKAGWDLSAVVCDDLNSTGSAGTRTATFHLDPGEVVTCTFTNVQRGTIRVVKVTNPSNGAGFVFSGDVAGTIGDGQVLVTGDLVAGTYTSTEAVKAGWDLTNLVCDDTDSVGNIGLRTATFHLQPGETVTCTFTNVQRGTIRVVKRTVPAGGTGFTFSGNVSGTIDDGGVLSTSDLVAGTYSSVEAVKAGWDLTGIACDDSDSSGDVGLRTATFNLQPGETVTCTFTNTQRGTINVRKVTQPAGGTGFGFSGDASGTIGDGGLITVANLVPGTYGSTEAAKAGWDLISVVCDDSDSVGSALGRTATFHLQAGENVTCTFTNRQRGGARIVKTVSGQVPSGTQSFVFQLRSGASVSSAGTILESVTADAGNGGVVAFGTSLVPGDTYQLCEVVMPGWMTTLGPPFYTVYNPSGDNSTVCSDFTVGAGEVKTFAIDNTPPPGGMARTIGFWKNWSSCSGGKQAAKLDQTLAAAVAAGSPILIGDLVFNSTNPATQCQNAVRILDKSDIVSGKKQASDPAYNLAAQLLAAKLNVQVGAGVCPAAVTAINSAQALLDLINFTGTGSYTKKMSAAQANQANTLATIIDNYNNNKLC